MHIEVFKFHESPKWGFRIIAQNNNQLARSVTLYARKSNAVETARKIAGKRMKVVVCE